MKERREQPAHQSWLTEIKQRLAAHLTRGLCVALSLARCMGY